MMHRIVFSLLITAAMPLANATFTLSTTQADYQVTNVFSDVDVFSIVIEIDEPLEARAYVNPTVTSVEIQVAGELEPGTPSGFAMFNLQRSMGGAEFYNAGTLSFTVSQAAVLGDGVQAAELVGGGVVLTFNAREEDTGRFHPPILQLNVDGTGRIQNSDNEPMPFANPPVTVALGEEYITDLVFDPGNTTLLVDNNDSPGALTGSGSGFTGVFELLALLLLWLRTTMSRKVKFAPLA